MIVLLLVVIPIVAVVLLVGLVRAAVLGRRRDQRRTAVASGSPTAVSLFDALDLLGDEASTINFDWTGSPR